MRSETGNSWQAIRAEVLRRIRARDWPPGSLIPNEADLAAEFGCARTTVSRALREIAATGLIERRRKAGTRVAIAPSRRATFDIPVLRVEIEARGARYGYALIAQGFDMPPPAVRAGMALPEGARLLHLSALHLADGAPLVHEDRWIDPDVAPGILTVDLARESANAWLVANMPYTDGSLSLFARAADAELAARLGCAEGAALFCMERLTWIGDKAITHVLLSYAPGHRIATEL